VKPDNLLFAKTHEWVAISTNGGQKSRHDRPLGVRCSKSADGPRLHRVAESGRHVEGRRAVSAKWNP